MVTTCTAHKKKSVPLTKQDLPEERIALVELMQRINFGRVENLRLSEGKPCLDPAPRVFREFKLSGENGIRPEFHRDNFVLKSDHLTLFALMDCMQNGTFARIEIKHGLPFMVTVEGMD